MVAGTCSGSELELHPLEKALLRAGVGRELAARQAGYLSRARAAARRTARSVYTEASCALYAADPIRSGRSSRPSAARAAAALIAAASAGLPCNACST